MSESKRPSGNKVWEVAEALSKIYGGIATGFEDAEPDWKNRTFFDPKTTVVKTIRFMDGKVTAVNAVIGHDERGDVMFVSVNNLIVFERTNVVPLHPLARA